MTASILSTTSTSTPDSIKAATNALKKFRVIYGTVRQHFREVEQSCGISGSQLWLLQEIHRTQNIGVSELANRLSIHQSTCSQLVDKLAKAKLVSKIRSEQDQRRVGLCITEQALAILAKAPSPAEGVLPEALNAMPHDVLLQLDHMLEKVIKQLGVRSHKLENLPLSDM
jgi:DNA-binding MarR family transcriptional regulator